MATCCGVEKKSLQAKEEAKTAWKSDDTTDLHLYDNCPRDHYCSQLL